jgi:hypothetical protein
MPRSGVTITILLVMDIVVVNQSPRAAQRTMETFSNGSKIQNNQGSPSPSSGRLVFYE